MHVVRRRVQLKSDLWELELIILNASVKWELTAWPLMDMVNVAVTHLVAGPWMRWSGPDFAELPGSPQSYPEHKRHCFEIYRP